MAIKIIIIALAIVFLFCFMWINRYHITPNPSGGVYRHDRWTGNIDFIFEEDILLQRGQKSSADYFGSLEKDEPKKSVKEILGTKQSAEEFLGPRPKPKSDEKQRPSASEFLDKGK